MKILYLNPLPRCGPIKSVLTEAGYCVTCVTGPQDALDLIAISDFSAVLMAEEVRNCEAIEFISAAHRKRPELLVFPLRVWRSELADELERLEKV